MNTNHIESQIRAALFNQGASLVGFADLIEIPTNIRYSLRFAVSIAVALDASAIRDISNGPTQEYYSEYRRANSVLSDLGKRCANIIRDRGYRAISKEPTGAGITARTQSTALPHKTVATRAGLGWVGKCALLVTREYGSAIRLTTVLTDSELETATPVDYSLCGDCISCVKFCPGKAPSGKNWNVNIHRDSFFDAFACSEAARKNAVTKIGIDDTICGICISVCPWTMRYIEKRV
jgi:epoxyqueuosine reductase QueG